MLRFKAPINSPEGPDSKHTGTNTAAVGRERGKLKNVNATVAVAAAAVATHFAVTHGGSNRGRSLLKACVLTTPALVSWYSHPATAQSAGTKKSAVAAVTNPTEVGLKSESNARSDANPTKPPPKCVAQTSAKADAQSCCGPDTFFNALFEFFCCESLLLSPLSFLREPFVPPPRVASATAKSSAETLTAACGAMYSAILKKVSSPVMIQ
mmetsp:Transcript_6046/g.22853  ORF Transcript_6046/g.22853 Transcript_6046/m.22853 type:complete len:210 (+) Transcript_6046:362-991(+)